MWISAGGAVRIWPLAGNESTMTACAKTSGLSVAARVASAMRSGVFMRPPGSCRFDAARASVFHGHVGTGGLLRLHHDIVHGIVDGVRRDKSTVVRAMSRLRGGAWQRLGSRRRAD